MVFTQGDVRRQPFGQFRCPRRRSARSGSGEERSAAFRTFFENCHLPLATVLRLMFAFAANCSYDDAMQFAAREEATVSRESVADWYNFCREVGVDDFLHRQEEMGQIGGPGTVVQIDEAKFGRRKYHRGRMVEGHWLLGMIQDGSEDFRLEICPDNERTAVALIPLIERHVAPGGIIRTDQWRAYWSLPQSGYIHETVNHSEEFVTTEGVHTQRIEAMWRPMRQFFRGRHIPEDSFADHVVEYQWRRNCRLAGLDRFHELVRAAAELWGHQPLAS